MGAGTAQCRYGTTNAGARPLLAPLRPEARRSGVSADAGRGVATVTKSRGVTVLAVTAGIAYVVLTVLVAVGATKRLDVAARQFFHPDDHLGDLR